MHTFSFREPVTVEELEQSLFESLTELRDHANLVHTIAVDLQSALRQLLKKKSEPHTA